ncbi:MAG TPA: hypothetical protein VGH24_04335 [Solirubrobacteraceae bacterium]
MTRRLLPLLLVSVALAVAGCGNKVTTVTGSNGQVTTKTTVSFAKTKFLLHAGLAFGTFHHFIYGPLKAGDFAHPLSHKATLAKAVVAGAFIIHEVKIALTDAQSSAILSKLVSPLTALGAGLAGVVAGIKSGHVDTSKITSSNSSISSIESTASSVGAKVNETVGAI